MKIMRLIFAALVAPPATASLAGAPEQTSRATISGIITGPDDASVPGAETFVPSC
jgi:hypothetical protein